MVLLSLDRLVCLSLGERNDGSLVAAQRIPVRRLALIFGDLGIRRRLLLLGCVVGFAFLFAFAHLSSSAGI
jgi:hypothetical protein